jgi:hypothetical protein
MAPLAHEVTPLLLAWNGGDPKALDGLIPHFAKTPLLRELADGRNTEGTADDT